MLASWDRSSSSDDAHCAPTPPIVTPTGYQTGGRYADRPTDWRTRLFGLGGVGSIALVALACVVFTWQRFAPDTAPSTPAIIVEMLPLAAPAEPVREIPPGPQQVEQKQQQSRERQEQPAVPIVPLPTLTTAQPRPVPNETATTKTAVPETTAPKSLPAPPAPTVSNNASPDWEARLLAHLEKFRQFPAAARIRREQGIAYVRFRMTRAGRVLSARITRSSGSPILDRAAVETLRRAQPLPPIPDDRADEMEMAVPVEFFLG